MGHTVGKADGSSVFAGPSLGRSICNGDHPIFKVVSVLADTVTCMRSHRTTQMQVQLHLEQAQVQDAAGALPYPAPAVRLADQPGR